MHSCETYEFQMSKQFEPQTVHISTTGFVC